ncbi:ABC transporter permease [Mycobacterium sp. 155]|uniref:ABC transporter permease n=1 Tax=Mycobacterium sp. 155 TaxID=1157943 RepID=UPI001E3A6B01|nr:ABC transporter permease [Mycobacterium sp. 155]
MTIEPATAIVGDQPKPPRPVLQLLARRIPLGILSVIVAAVIVYWATVILPGDAAQAILGQLATPERLAALRAQLGLDKPALQAFFDWSWGFLHGDFGTSLTQHRPVWQVVEPKLLNSAALVAVVLVLSTVVGVAAGMWTARRPDGFADTVLGVVSLVAASLPEFVVGVLVLLALAVGPLKFFPALSSVPPDTPIWTQPEKMVLPILTLMIVVTPYVYRMVRAATIEALASDYCEVAVLKGTAPWRVLIRHALPNALAPTIQVVGLNLLYLAGGIVMVETVFTYPGIGRLLVDAINTRDIPVLQFVVVLLAIFYVCVNILADVLVLVATPRRRFPR